MIFKPSLHARPRLAAATIPLLAALCGGLLTAAPLERPADALWRPESDAVYLQEVGRKIPSETPVTAVAVFDGAVYAGRADGLFTLAADKLEPVPDFGVAIRFLRTLDGALWVGAANGLHRLRDGKWTTLTGERADAICLHRGTVVIAVGRELHEVLGDQVARIQYSQAPAPVRAMDSYAETIYCLHEGSMSLFTGKGFDRVNVIDWGELPSKTTRDMIALGGRLYVATDRGLGLLRGMAMTSVRGAEGLCYEDTTSLARGFDGDLWIGTPRGAIRSMPGAGPTPYGEFHYFAGPRWLPNDNVRAIAASDRAVYVATDGGIGVIEYEPYTLRKKAAYYERHLEEWGQKRLGFTHKLFSDGKGGWQREVSDNDCGWSADYLAAMTFKYAATGEESARDEAVNTFRALKWAEEATPIDGFPARSMWAKGETGVKAQHGSGGLPAEWHDTADGLFEWKGDTSSDETDAHFYAVSIFHDLAARGREKEQAAEHLNRIASHMIREGWVLRDVDGKPTRWARWDPEYLQRPYGYYARGLNGLEILSYMRTAHALTGDAKFEKAIADLMRLGYHRESLRQKLVFPPDDVTQFDDRLAMFAYYPLLKYESDPYLRSIYMRSLERSWEVERMEHNPWYNFVYGALTGNDFENAQAVRHLREWPLDLINWSFRNSQRHDMATPPGYISYAEGRRGLSPRETSPMLWSNATTREDGGEGAGSVTDPSGWLEAYWMGRYYGFIEGPATDDPELIGVPRRGLNLGAAPYAGPPRPKLRGEE